VTRIKLASLSLVAVVATASSAQAVIPDAVPDLPVLGAETPAGSIATSVVAPVAPSPKTVDGDPSDWTGQSTRLGGTSIYSRGEFVYQDYLNDDWGADDGFDAERLATHDQLADLEPRTYRNDALQQAAGDQFGVGQPVGAQLHYGDANQGARRNEADIVEARIAADGPTLSLMVRLNGLSHHAGTAVVLLIDTEDGGDYPAPGLAGTKAEWAFVVAGDDVVSASFKGAPVATGAAMAVATDESDFVNTIEASVDLSFLASFGPVPAAPAFGVATALTDDQVNPSGLAATRTGDAQSDLINVGFRSERVRIWMDRAQALALRLGSMDEFLAPVDLDALRAGRTETFQQRPGYYEQVYVASDSPVNQESESGQYFQGIFQHYGVYLPRVYRPGTAYPTTFWMHYRGGHAHDAGAWLPGVMRHFGDRMGGIVVTPSARGTSTWYTGRGMVDYLDVWADSHERYPIDESRTYVGGHSMGGFASFLLGLLFPDRWAAANPEDGPIVPGLWTGFTEPIEPQNDGDLQAEFLYTIIGNARNLPYAILHGTEDELVPVSGAIRIGETLHEMGNTYRLYLFHTYEHYSAPIVDDWREIVDYMSTFTLDRDPPHVTYSVWPALNHAVSTISVPAGVDLGFDFDGAYWVDGLETRTPGIDPSNVGTIDAVTYGRGFEETIGVPEAGTAAQPEPYTMNGQRRLVTGYQSARNWFDATMTNLSSATLDVVRMGLSTGSPIVASVTTDGPTTLRLAGGWHGAPEVVGASTSTYAGGVLTLTFDASGTHVLTIG